MPRKKSTDRSPRRKRDAQTTDALTEFELDFSQSPTVWDFLNSDNFVRGIMGPVGSGKSYACCAEIFLRAVKQAPSPRDGIRHTRFAIIRNSYPELRTTTLKTWQEIFPENKWGAMRWSPPITHHIQLPPRGDAAGIDCEVIFLALDQPRDTRRVLSLELTGAFVDEVRELPKAIIDALTSRVGRYPSKLDGGATWRGVWMCSNPMDDDHWYYRLAEKEKPGKGAWAWKFFRQPGGVHPGSVEDKNAIFSAGKHWVPNPKAENTNNLPPGYYQQQLQGKNLDWINAYAAGLYTFVQEGRAVWQEYTDSTMSVDSMEIDYSLPIHIGLDFGLTPAAVFGQRHPSGQWNMFYELVTEDMGLERFGQMLLYELNTRFDKLEPLIWGDPAGSKRDEIFEVTAFDHLRTLGLNAKPTATNDFQVRREAGAAPMTRLINGKPGLQIHKDCHQLRKALTGGYYFKREAISGGQERFRDKPYKNNSSHVGDAYGYICLGGGEHRRLTRGSHRPGINTEPVIANTEFSVF
tara:strand:+ start:11743 stop:13305 length:1563 start_codon:yes stop_codon:yes gene_type:complete